jgi:hypothetical protein
MKSHSKYFVSYTSSGRIQLYRSLSGTNVKLVVEQSTEDYYGEEYARVRALAKKRNAEFPNLP